MSVADGIFDGLFKAKLRDNNIDYSDDDYKRFCAQLSKSYGKGILDLSGQRIGINTLTKLTKVLRTAPHIRVFNFYGNLIRDHGLHSLLQLLTANTQVEVLNIGCNDLTNSSVTCIIDIIRNTNIRSLQLGATGVAWHNNKFIVSSVGDILGAVQEAERIQCLGLSGLRMSERQGQKRNTIVQILADFIAYDEVISSIVISDNGFTLKEEDVVTVQGLLQNPRLRYVDFHENQLSDPVGPNFCSQLGHMENLMYLDLRACHLSSAAGQALAESLKEPNKLIVLNVAENELKDDGACAILQALLENETMTEINLAGNHMTDASADAIGACISQNKVLYSLNLSRNAIGDEGAYAIAESLPSNDALCILDISSCRMSDPGAIAIAESLRNNSCLKTLKMKDNFLTRECGYKIIEHVRLNEHLFSIDVSSSQINHFVIKALKELCTRNTQIQKEIGLQPLKKELVQLSIQRTKMPEAESRLKALERDRDHVEREVMQAEEDIDVTQTTADSNMQQLNKQIQSTFEMIHDERKGIEKITIDKEKMLKEYGDRYQDIMADTEREKVIAGNVEVEHAKLDELMKANELETQQKRAEMEAQIEELRKMIEETIEIGKDPQRLREYERPQLPVFMEPTKDAFFLNDEILDLKDTEDKKKKGKKGKRKASPKSGRKKSPRAKSSLQNDINAPAPAAAPSARSKTSLKKPVVSARRKK